jgi:hypothetical protein
MDPFWVSGDSLVVFAESGSRNGHKSHIRYRSESSFLTDLMHSISNRIDNTVSKIDSEDGLYYYRARLYNPATGELLREGRKGFSASGIRP